MASFETDTSDNNKKLQVSRADHGQWMCLVNDNREFNSLKQFLNLNVGVTPDTGISVEAGEVFDKVDNYLTPKRMLDVKTKGNLEKDVS